MGKTSVLRAGVVPQLRERRELLPFVFPRVGIEPQAKSASVVLRGWQNDPLGGIKETTAIALYASAGDDLALYRRFQDAVLTYEMAPLREFLTACHEVSGCRLMVILDQFEEYSLYHPEDDAFGEQFPSAITPGDLSVSFLVSLREDAIAKLDRFKGRIPALWDSYRRIDHLDRAAAEKAIRLPLREYNRQHPGSVPMKIEDALVEAVLRDVRTESVQFEEGGGGTLAAGKGAERRIETPYLQMVLERLWDAEMVQASRTVRLATLGDLGGAKKIVRTHLDKVMERLGEAERETAARVFRFLAWNFSSHGYMHIFEVKSVIATAGRGASSSDVVAAQSSHQVNAQCRIVGRAGAKWLENQPPVKSRACWRHGHQGVASLRPSCGPRSTGNFGKSRERICETSVPITPCRPRRWSMKRGCGPLMENRSAGPAVNISFALWRRRCAASW